MFTYAPPPCRDLAVSALGRNHARFRPAFTRKWFRRTAPASTSEVRRQGSGRGLLHAFGFTVICGPLSQLFWPRTIP